MDTDPESGAMAQEHTSNRAPSRASTASIHSATAQHSMEQSFVAQQGHYPDQHWGANGHNQPRELHPDMSTEDMMRSASQMHAGQSFPMDNSMQSSVSSHGLSFPQHQQGLPTDSFGQSVSFTEGDSQMMDREDLEEGDSVMGSAPNPKPSSNKTSANNELEMRALFHSNRHRSLQDVATELHGNERGPNSERTRQVFAMLWINQVCSKGKGSVPRGRVYANYASRCATERTTVLNPASFGKLVRVLFPGLKTRRLGVRGESKYHYVNFALADGQPETAEPMMPSAVPFPEPASFSHTLSTVASQSPKSVVPKRSLPTPEIVHQPHPVEASHPRQNRTHSLYNQPNISSIDLLYSTTSKTAQHMAFCPENEEPFQQEEPLVLPKIDPFLPGGTDPDAAMSLTALYRSHCTSLVECIRYCKEKTFFHLYTSFQGTLTMPVQKLFANPAMAPWIEQCDFVLYQRMMRIVSGLTLQVIPHQVITTLRNISERLVTHIHNSFQGQPRHVIQAKVAPATIFAALLDRALRVNMTAHAAANMLSNPANRDEMYLDWITMVRVRKAAECVPTRGMDDVVNLLLGEIRDVLDPRDVPWEIECHTLYGEVAARNREMPRTGRAKEANASNVLDRWVAFLRSLSIKFSYARPEEVVTCVQTVGTAIMRDITISSGKSFGSWWVTKCWVDEMIAFLAEQGGFMKLKSTGTPLAGLPKRPEAAVESSRSESQLDRGSEESDSMPNNVSTELDPAAFQSHADNHARDSMGAAVNPDDSGIGMRTPEEEFPMDKFDLPQDHAHGLSALGLEQSY